MRVTKLKCHEYGINITLATLIEKDFIAGELMNCNFSDDWNSSFYHISESLQNKIYNTLLTSDTK